MKKSSIALIALAVLAYVGYQEYRMNRLEDHVEHIDQSVRKVQGVVEEMKTEIVHTNEKIAARDEELKCLAMNVFNEAGVEDKIGQVAVAHVTLNRVKSGRWGNSICKVVYAKAQFSWTLEKKKRWKTPKGQLWERAKEVAREVLDGERVSTLNGSLYYHTDYIETPKWAVPDNKIAQIGQHIFYTKALVVIKKKPKQEA